MESLLLLCAVSSVLFPGYYSQSSSSSNATIGPNRFKLSRTYPTKDSHSAFTETDVKLTCTAAQSNVSDPLLDVEPVLQWFKMDPDQQKGIVTHFDKPLANDTRLANSSLGRANCNQSRTANATWDLTCTLLNVTEADSGTYVCVDFTPNLLVTIGGNVNVTLTVRAKKSAWYPFLGFVVEVVVLCVVIFIYEKRRNKAIAARQLELDNVSLSKDRPPTTGLPAPPAEQVTRRTTTHTTVTTTRT